ncbi:MAG: translation elongation factor EF-1 subunit alpha [Candidatus Aenigmarchaeota archaeon]|nr:translation elongation factor EF-1 subunit alpha [Candidatus Aenigmarchaeota archaeon]MDI6722241.1 translation elongation factor EF-1 subunit alpha [Candidatus Aenigmarchaeota archaeon]
MADKKPHFNLVTIGHVDHGKSTLVGRLLYDTGSVKEEQMRKLKDIAKDLKKETFEFAFVMDNLKEERERGVTIDIMHKRFDTNKFYFTIIDAPGHRDFVKNMITGTSQADGAILVCSAKEGVQEQTKEHAYLAKVLGVKQMIVAVNKMDAVNYDEKKYTETKDAATKLLKSIGYKAEEMNFIPTSGYVGDNVAKKSDKMAWYKGPTIIEALDQFTLPEQPVDKPLRVPIQDVYTITGIGTVPVGRVETGILKVNDKVVFVPSGSQGDIKSIEMHHEQAPEARPGDNIGFNVRGIGKGDIKRGDVMCHPQNAAKQAKEFTAQIVVLNHPSVISKGYTPVFHVHTSQVACTITEIIKKLDPKTGQTAQENPDFIKTGDAAIIKCVPSKPLVIEKQTDLPQMARFAIRDMGQTVAAGVCIDVVTV